MTPAVNQLKKAKVRYWIHKYDHDPETKNYGEEAADKLNVPYDRLFKTLVVEAGKRQMMVAVVPVSVQLDLKAFAKAVKAKKAVMADKQKVERITGYLLGGVSPLGQKNHLPTVIDNSAEQFETIYVSAGRRGLQVELSPQDLSAQTGARFCDISG